MEQIEKRKIGIVGFGYVGKKQWEFWKWGKIYRVDAIDKGGSHSFINSSDLAVVCVPTPELKDGSCDISIVESVVKWIKAPVILLKSTVPPGTTDFLREKFKKRIVFSPEFVTETKFYNPHNPGNQDIQSPFYILGGESQDTKYVYDLLAPIVGPSKKIIQTSARNAEMAKYVLNAFIALKVTFSNEIKIICDALDLDYNEIRELWTLDPRVNREHTMVFEDKPGFGGKCLPKDVKALIKFSEARGYSPQLIEEVVKSNKRIRSLK